MLNEQRARVATRRAYIDQTGRYPMDRLTKTVLSLGVCALYRAAFLDHTERVERALRPQPAIDLVALVESILFVRRAA
jgi:hypothetical protein